MRGACLFTSDYNYCAMTSSSQRRISASKKYRTFRKTISVGRILSGSLTTRNWKESYRSCSINTRLNFYSHDLITLLKSRRQPMRSTRITTRSSQRSPSSIRWPRSHSSNSSMQPLLNLRSNHSRKYNLLCKESRHSSRLRRWIQLRLIYSEHSLIRTASMDSQWSSGR